jgi:hypothetical protein
MVSQLYAHGNTKEALVFFDLLSEKYPKIRLDPGMQLLWASIAAKDKRGMEALKKIDWVIETFPDHCKNNPDMVLITQAQAFDAAGDKKESRRLWEQLEQLIKSNSKYSGLKQMVDSKLMGYRQEDERIKQRQEASDEARRNPYGSTFPDANVSNDYWDVPRIVMGLVSVCLLIIALIMMFIRKKNK